MTNDITPERVRQLIDAEDQRLARVAELLSDRLRADWKA